MPISVRSALAQGNGRIHLLEAHDRNSEDIVRSAVGADNQAFHGVWISGLTQTTYLGIPDSEIISPLQRASLIDFYGGTPQKASRELCAAYDADSGGPAAEIPALVAVLVAMGVGMVIIEDKEVAEPGKKVNSLASSSASQGQADMHEFADTIRIFKEASTHKDFMVTARIESFTTRVVQSSTAEEKASVQAALAEALARAEVYRDAGADAIMIHSKSKQADEVLSFLGQFRAKDPDTPLVVVPTTYSKTPEDVLHDAGASVVIYANHLMRAKINAGNEISQDILPKQLDLFSRDSELDVCLKARNFGCLMPKMLERKYLGGEAKAYLQGLEAAATERMKAAARCLLDAKMACGADEHLIPVKELLEINGRQISYRLGPIVLPGSRAISASTSEDSLPSKGKVQLRYRRWQRGFGDSVRSYTRGWMARMGVSGSWKLPTTKSK
ncbi:phosphoenolpyruvate phosphomutase domain-containing protein [Hirsutella rhossiliensis]|uniref:Phosphoenolpyruvate phosphomutase domain-containing protein n=1 Tax=Hirsutella rhossiliensis TaxID=111463 RepID=A0A9P8N250_9HYPO|nr:phosphoenolpyruvate phosphomutase domain-containing protein [Hirsutella rhossiliensis]KAH0963327.1 phosphoenolpyruvate phosphomutase domain-containing protein [Hirsutella rhossiliensis]